jgi:COP9 signalosome complex subunit 6
MEAYKLHPLVLINVSDHHTRVAAQLDPGESSVERVMGCLLGFQTGTREVEICTSFEVATTRDAATDAPGLDASYLSDQIARYKQVFPKFDVVGWYATGAGVDRERDMPIHRSLSHLNENPVFLLFDPRNTEKKTTPASSDVSERDSLPVTLHEACWVSDSSDGSSTREAFRDARFVVETVEAERVSVDHVSRLSVEENGAAGALAQHVASFGSAVSMLETRLGGIVRYLKQVQAGSLTPDREILRAAASVAAAAERMRAARLPTDKRKGGAEEFEDDAFVNDFAREMGDAEAAQYLGLVTKAAADFEQFARRHAAVHDRGGRRF